MKMNLILISKMISFDKGQKMSCFHFCGVYLGYKIKVVKIFDENKLFIKNKTYVIHVSVAKVENHTVFGVFDKFQVLD